ncbi:MAG: hypothetical protein KKE23_00765 [Nanoarchaeota archaeon]|nr:hypothetical protein [Nanoarchaeota archaeon]
MEIKILTQIEKPYLGRKEIVLKGSSAITPSKIELKEEAAKLTSSPAEMVVIKKVNQQFGRKDFEVEVYVYSDEKSMKEFENTKKSGISEQEKKKAEGAAA